MEPIWLWIDTLTGAEFLALLAAVGIGQFLLVSLAGVVVAMWQRRGS